MQVEYTGNVPIADKTSDLSVLLEEEQMISVIIPTFNRGYIIETAIRSVLSQTYEDIELIIVDDCSTDCTESLVKAIAQEDDRLRYTKLDKRSGACVARNVGIEMARGEYIAFQDSDDSWRPNKLETQFKALLESGADVCTCRFKRHNFDDVFDIIYPTLPSGFICRQMLITRSQVSTGTILAKRAVFNDFVFDSEMPRLQDFEWTIRASERYRFFLVDDVLVDTYLQDDSITSTSQEVLMDSFRLIWKKHAGLCAKHPEFEFAIRPLAEPTDRLAIFFDNLTHVQDDLATHDENSRPLICDVLSDPDSLKALIEVTRTVMQPLNPYRGGIYLDYGSGYSKDVHFHPSYRSVEHGIVTLGWDLNACCDGNTPCSIRIDPDEGTMRKYRVVDVTLDDQPADVRPLNAFEHSDGWDVFFTIDPMYELVQTSGTGMLSISFESKVVVQADIMAPIEVLQSNVEDLKQRSILNEQTIAEQQAKINSQQEQVSRLSRNNSKQRKELNKVNKKLDSTSKRLAKLENNLKSIKQSHSWRIGRGVTWLPRKIKRLHKQ